MAPNHDMYLKNADELSSGSQMIYDILINNESGNLAFQKLQVPKKYHPIICGPKNENIHRLMKETCAKIKVPPQSVMKDEIVISGDKDGVAKCKDEIMRIYIDKKRKCQTVAEEVRKTHHKYITEPINRSMYDQILKETEGINVVSLIAEIEITLGANTMVHSEGNLSLERLQVPKKYHPYICGPKNENIHRLMKETCAKIKVPPQSVMKDEIVISGDKDGVAKCKDEIMRIYMDKKRKCQTVAVEVRKTHHKYIIEPRNRSMYDQILKETEGINVVSLIAEIELAITLGANTMVHSEGNLSFERLQVPKKYHPYICGPKNENIHRLMKETCAKIKVPPQSVMKDEIVISGDKDGVAKCKDEIMRIYMDKKRKCQTGAVEVRKTHHKYIIEPRNCSINDQILKETEGINVVSFIDERELAITLGANTMVHSKENEMTRDIIIEQRFHEIIIGDKGATIERDQR